MDVAPEVVGDISGQLIALESIVFCVCEEIKAADEDGEVSKRIVAALSKRAMLKSTQHMPPGVEKYHYAQVGSNNRLLEKYLDLFNKLEGEEDIDINEVLGR